MDRLRELDDRALAPLTRQPPAVQARNCCLIGVGACLTVVALSVPAHDPVVLVGLPGLAGMTIANAVRWWNHARGAPDPTRGVRSVWLVTVAVAVVTGALVVGSALHRPQRAQLPGPTPLRQPTMVVLCPATPMGDAYTYQTTATATPQCKNGAKPNVILRG